MKSFPRLVSPISLDASRKRHVHLVKPRPSTAAIGFHAVTGTGQAGGDRRFGKNLNWRENMEINHIQNYYFDNYTTTLYS